MAGKVEGVVGYPVTIPCDITPPTPGNIHSKHVSYHFYCVKGRGGISGLGGLMFEILS